VSDLFLAKDLNGYPATFVGFEGPDRFIIEVDGVERAISREEWRSLTDRPPAGHGRRDRQDRYDEIRE